MIMKLILLIEVHCNIKTTELTVVTRTHSVTCFFPVSGLFVQIVQETIGPMCTSQSSIKVLCPHLGKYKESLCGVLMVG